MLPRPSRREFLGGVSALGASLLAAPARQEPAPAPLPLRPLGKTGRVLPALGLGCHPMGTLDSEEDALAVVRRAHETGARYFDTAPSYSNGRSEARLGKALAGLPREELFVATKTLERDGDAALAELESSLERLRMDYVDSVQVHEVRSEKDVEAILRPGGIVRALEAAREKGKVLHIGVTCHRDPRFALLAIERYPFATALVPVNPLDCHHLSFTRDFVPRAREKGVAVAAMKVLAGGTLPRQKPEIPAADLVRFALAQDGVCMAVPGAGSVAQWDEARSAAAAPPPDAEAQAALVERAGPHRGKDSEWYKDEG